MTRNCPKLASEFGFRPFCQLGSPGETPGETFRPLAGETSCFRRALCVCVAEVTCFGTCSLWQMTGVSCLHGLAKRLRTCLTTPEPTHWRRKAMHSRDRKVNYGALCRIDVHFCFRLDLKSTLQVLQLFRPRALPNL